MSSSKGFALNKVGVTGFDPATFSSRTRRDASAKRVNDDTNAGCGLQAFRPLGRFWALFASERGVTPRNTALQRTPAGY